MPKAKKKRTKRYTGEDAAPTALPVTIHKITAVDRSRIGQWWFEKKKVVKPIAITTSIVIIIAWLIYELVRVVT